ncbi:MAG: sigma factor [Candidatus Thorarchaeota archaeon]
MIIEDLSESNKRAKRKNKKIKSLLSNNKSAYKEAVESFSTSQEELAAAFYILSSNIVNFAKFQNIDPEDAVQEGVMICFEKIDRFDPRKGKAFNYMTTCILNHFRQMYRSQRNYTEFKHKYQEFMQTKLNHNIIKNGKEISIPMTGSRI